MNYRETKQILNKDLKRNTHPRNAFFLKCFRIGQWSYHCRNDNCATMIIYIVCRILLKVTINRYNHYPLEIKIGEGIRLPHNIGIVLAGNAIIGENCTIFHQVTVGADPSKGDDMAPIIGNNVFIGAGAKIIGKLLIGDNVKIGANAVVTKDVPSNSTVINCNQILEVKKVT